ncbi:MAG: acyl-CoA desaturase [bacterium]|nr:acyl-CoA desaturase [bacterium]
MMNTVKFKGTDIREKNFAMALKKNVNAYFKTNNISTKANAAMVVKTIVLIALYIAPFVLILSIPMSGLLALLCTVVMGIGVAGVGMGVMHDATHGAYSNSPWVNKLFAGTIYLLGSNSLNWKIQHNVLHHTYTNITGLDEDIDNKGPIRLSERMPYKKIYRFQYLYAVFFYGLMTLTMLTNDFIRLTKYSKMGLVGAQNKKLGSEFTKMLLRKTLYLIVIIGLPLWLTPFSIWQILLGFFVMHWVASIILSLVFQMAHVVEGTDQEGTGHDITSDWHVHQLKTTSDFAKSNKLLSWYVGGLNFQVEHHLFPTICHVHYKHLAPIVAETAREYNVPYHSHPSFRAALRSHFTKLKELGLK